MPLPCFCWVLYILIPLIFILSIIHRPASLRLRLWVARVLEKWHKAQIRWITPKGGVSTPKMEQCPTCKGTKQVVRSSYDFRPGDGDKYGTTCWYESCPDCVCQVCNNTGQILKSQGNGWKMFQPCYACKK